MGRPVEVATFVADDPAAVGFDVGPAVSPGPLACPIPWSWTETRRTSSARTTPRCRMRGQRDVVDLHARLIALSLAARTASQASGVRRRPE